MRKTKTDPHILDHLEWLAFVRPTGLVVSAPALVRAGAILERRDAEGQRLLNECVHTQSFGSKSGSEPFLPDFEKFARTVLGWRFSPKGYAGGADCPTPDDLSLAMPDAGDTLRPDFAVRELEPKDGAAPWQLLVNIYDPHLDFDQVLTAQGHLELSPSGRMERLLRSTGVGAGLLFNGRVVRLVSAPRGESSGWLDFRVRDMVTTSGRPICAALRMLLNEQRLLALPKNARLASLLENSRKYQNEVSERLAEQVLHALYELMRGFQAAHDASRGQLLKEVLNRDPDRVYRALLTVLLRIVFLLYAEERDMLPGDETFVRYYGLGGLHERLRADTALHPDTMDQRFGAWAQLLVLFRMVYDGAAYGDVHLPKRHGDLFDPERYPLLEGRSVPLAAAATFDIPHVPDGAIYRALEKLLVLDGERLSYRALDVEQIGSVYETMMGFRVEVAAGQSIAIKAEKAHGAPTTINLEALLCEPAAKREKWLQDNAGRKLSDTVKKGVRESSTLTDLHAALDKVIDRQATPDQVAKFSLVLQPSEERRRSGSHYTPRTLTEPIVRTTLDPILARLKGEDGSPPRPVQILDLKVCDPAMGSGAFLVESCRQLADSLLDAWRYHGGMPTIPYDEDEVVFARRQIAQRCLYGVDKNPMAVDLAKVSLWLVTLAKDHSFTFLDHALRCGDSLVGLTQAQIGAVHWKQVAQIEFLSGQQRETIDRVTGYRREILNARDDVSYDKLRLGLDMAEEALRYVRLIGDAVIAAYFAGKDSKERETTRRNVGTLLEQYFDKTKPQEDARKPLDEMIAALRSGQHAVAPLHWHIEFPEVFEVDPTGKPARGFDAIVGNPPFAGHVTITVANRLGFSDFLRTTYDESGGKCDLVAFFFRKAFSLLRLDGCFGLIATNTIGQGDTRSSGLRWICHNGGNIYAAHRRLPWPGEAAVVVSTVHVIKGECNCKRVLDGRTVEKITAFLFHTGRSDDPIRLAPNMHKAFQGCVIRSSGFTFDDTNPKSSASSLAHMRHLIDKDPRNAEIIFPYIGGEEVNNSPTQSHDRFVINFGDREEAEARTWPDLFSIAEAKVLPERSGSSAASATGRVIDKFWQFGHRAKALYDVIRGFDRVLVTNCGATPHMAFAFLPAGTVFAHSLDVVATESLADFCLLQSRIHEIWARFFSSSMKDDLRYTPSDCFENFPFPAKMTTGAGVTLEASGTAYYEFRASLMVGSNEGLTKTYNRFHDPAEHDSNILGLRHLHSAMDTAVLHAYGWQDIQTDCEFILDYEEGDEDDGAATSRRKKPWRYRWPDDVRDEVLSRLLELNALRAAEDQGLDASGNTKTTHKKSRSRVSNPEHPRLIET